MSFINIALSVLVFTGASIAFLGETLDKSKASVLERITKLGWVSLMCLVGTFVLAVRKEDLDARDKEALQNKANDFETKLRASSEKLAKQQDLLDANQVTLNDKQALSDKSDRTSNIEQWIWACEKEAALAADKSTPDEIRAQHLRAIALWREVFAKKSDLELPSSCPKPVAPAAPSTSSRK